MPIELVYGARPGDNAIGKRVDSIVQQMEQEKARALEASIAAARINAQMSAQNAENRLRARAMDLEAQKEAARLGLSAQIENRRMFADEARLGLQARQQDIGAWNEQAQRNFLAERDQALWAQNQDKMLAEQLNERQAAASKANLTPEGQQLYRDWASKLRAVQKQVGNLRPAQASGLRAQLLEDFDNLGLQRFQVQEPTIDEHWQKNAVRLDDGSWVVREQSRNGFSWRQINPAKQEQSKKPGAQLDLGSYMSDRKNYLKEWDSAAGRIMERRKNEMPVDGKMPSYPTDDEIQREMDSHLQRWQGAFQGGGQPPMPQNPMPDTLSVMPGQPNMAPNPGQPPVAPPGPPAASSSGSMRVTPEMRKQVEAAIPVLGELRKIGDPEINAAVNVLTGVKAAVATGQMDPSDPVAQQAVQKAQMVIQERTAKRDADRQATEAIKTIGQDKVEGSLKRVKDASDYNKVKSGETYIDPNGQKRVKP